MYDTIRKLTLALLVALPLPALAQESGGAAEGEGGGDVPSGISMGTEVQDEPRVGDQYLVDVFEDWAMRCLKTEAEEDPCQLYQLLLDEQDNAVAEITIFKLPEGSGDAVAGSTIVAPLETLLTANVRLAVDSGQSREYPFSFCTTAGCVARLGFRSAEVDQFKRGLNATLTIVPAADPEQEVNLTVSLIGFTAGFEALAARETAN